MAQSPAVLDAYLHFSGALSHGLLPAPLREQLAITSAEANGCDYCLAAHTTLGKGAGLTPEAIASARRGTAPDPRADAAVRFARSLLRKQGRVDDADVQALRSAGYGDGEIAEVIAHVALNVFTNYFNNAAGTEVDFPRPDPLPAGA